MGNSSNSTLAPLEQRNRRTNSGQLLRTPPRPASYIEGKHCKDLDRRETSENLKEMEFERTADKARVNGLS